MDIDTLYSNVNLKAKKKSKSAFGGDDDSDDIDYTLIDFTNSGNKQRRPNAVDSEAVTYAAVKTPQPGVSREPVCRDGTESDDVIYYKITQPNRDGLFSQSSAQHNEPLPTQSGHTPAAFMAHSDPFPMTMMTPVRETQQRFFQRPTFLLFLCLLFFTLTLILGVLYSLEENAHADTMAKYESLQSVHRAVQNKYSQSARDLSELREEKKSIQSQLIDVKNSLQIERDKSNNLSLEKDTRETQFTKALESLKNLNNTHGRLSTEKLSLEIRLSDVNRNLETEKSRNKQLTREKQEKENELSNLENQKTNAEKLRDQYNTSLSDTQKKLDEQKISNAFLSHIKDSIEVELKDLEMGCAIGWRNFTEKCYFFSTENETWIKSRDTCQARGGHLVIIDSDKERTFLKDTAPGNSKTFYWIGLTDAEKEGTWRWVDNKVLAGRHWTSDEPDNWTDDNKRPEGEDCARANAKEGLWMDAFCDGKLQYICEATAAVKP
ncbi:C-type lectin domain family 4 member K-like isoform X2 [Sardina pilchardus]|uniref:C-type lectin domain family 4 member K-like isoform X2 n=1 Tax=Sardina pilchardus TaxID=27697 RepID=UPI002E1023D2